MEKKVTEHPFSLKIVQSDYNTNDKWSINIEIKIGDELDTFGATVFDKAKKRNKVIRKTKTIESV